MSVVCVHESVFFQCTAQSQQLFSHTILPNVPTLSHVHHSAIQINMNNIYIRFTLTIKFRVPLACELYHALRIVFNKCGASGMRYTKWPLRLIFGALYVTPDFWYSEILCIRKNFRLLEAPSATTETTVKPASYNILMALHTTGMSCSAVAPTKIIIYNLHLDYHTCCCKMSNW